MTARNTYTINRNMAHDAGVSKDSSVYTACVSGLLRVGYGGMCQTLPTLRYACACAHRISCCCEFNGSSTTDLRRCYLIRQPDKCLRISQQIDSDVHKVRCYQFYRGSSSNWVSSRNASGEPLVSHYLSNAGCLQTWRFM